MVCFRAAASPSRRPAARASETRPCHSRSSSAGSKRDAGAVSAGTSGASAAEQTLRQMTASTRRGSSGFSSLDDILLAHRPLEADYALRFELSDDRDDLLLRGLDLLDLDRAHRLHLF